MHSARRFTASKYNFALTFTHGQFSKGEKKLISKQMFLLKSVQNLYLFVILAFFNMTSLLVGWISGFPVFYYCYFFAALCIA